jgi:hypothetical protein
MESGEVGWKRAGPAIMKGLEFTWPDGHAWLPKKESELEFVNQRLSQLAMTLQKNLL